MRKISFILMAFLAMWSVETLAQYSHAQWRLYYKNSKSYGICDNIDSVAFVTDDYRVSVSAEAALTPKAEWSLKVTPYCSFSIESMWVGVVPANTTEEDILNAYNQGTWKDQLKNVTTSGETVEFVCGDGLFVPIVIGLDKDGKIRNYMKGREINVSEAYASLFF